MQGFYIDDGFSLSLRSLAKHPGRALQQLIAPLLDLVRMNVEILRQLDQRLLALDRGHRHFRLECRTVIPAPSSRHGHLLARGNHAAVARKIHLSRLSRFAEPPLNYHDGPVRSFPQAHRSVPGQSLLTRLSRLTQAHDPRRSVRRSENLNHDPQGSANATALSSIRASAYWTGTIKCA